MRLTRPTNPSCELPAQRAVEALKSNHIPLQGEAIYALVSSRDPGTMEDLVEATSASGTMNLESQVLAVEVLRTYVADQAFADEVAINALVQLIQRGNEAVSNVARQALLDMQQFREASVLSNRRL